MRSAFPQYFRPTDDELRSLWQDGLFSFDASVLLNVYGYSDETREELVVLVEKHAERVRLAHQFALEYARERSSVIIKQVANYQRVEKSLQQIKEVQLAPKRDHPFLTAQSLTAFESIQAELEECRKQMERLIGLDPYADRLLKAFEGKVGVSPSAEELQKLCCEAGIRYEKKVPPGFADLKEKECPDAYGDYIGWHQLMCIAKAEKKGIILVIDDFKEDWWRIECDRTVGPRPELMEEFEDVTGQRIYLYTSENFLRSAKEFMAAVIHEDVIEEVRQRLASQRDTLRASLLKMTPKETTPTTELKSARASDDKTSSGIKATAADDQDKAGAKADDEK